MTMADVLEAEGLRPRREDGTPFEHALDYRSGSGRVVCIVGPNGGGKTAYLRAMSGVDAPAAGHVRLFGQDVSQLDVSAWRALRRRAAFINEGAPLLSVVSGLSNVTLPAMYHRLGSADMIRMRAQETVEWLGYPGRLDILPAYLSQHERLLLAIARCLMLSPELLFLDEPFHMADSACRQRESEIYVRLARERNIAVFIGTHNLGFVKRHADEIVFTHPHGVWTFSDWQTFSDSKRPEIRAFLSLTT